MHLDRDYRVFDNDTNSWVKRYNLGHPVDSSKFKFLKSSKESDYSFLPVRLSHFQAIQKFYPVQRYYNLLTFEFFWFEVKPNLSNWSKAQLTTSLNFSNYNSNKRQQEQRNHSHLATTTQIFDVVTMSSEMGCIVINVTVRTWRQKKTHRCRQVRTGP